MYRNTYSESAEKSSHLVPAVFQNGADDVKKHRWFKMVDWEAVPLRKLKVRQLF